MILQYWVCDNEFITTTPTFTQAQFRKFLDQGLNWQKEKWEDQ